MSNERPVQQSGGGIVSRGGERSGSDDILPDDMAGQMRALRRRWASGVAVATTRATDNAFRGITLTSVMHVSLDPPYMAFALTSDGEFLAVLRESGTCCIHILEQEQEFVSERFAGRAPLVDARFSGVPHTVVDGLPVLTGSHAWAIGTVERIEPTGDHDLVVVRVTAIRIGGDTDDPLVSYDARYRVLEAS